MPPLFKNATGQVRNGWKILGFAALAAGIVWLLAALGQLLAGEGRALPEAWVAFLGVLLASWICVRLEGETLGSLSLRMDRRTPLRAALGLLLGAALLFITAGILVALGGLRLAWAHPVSVAAVLGAGAATLGVALAEECFFRGYVLQRAIRGLGPRAAVAVVSLVFMLAHQVDPAMGSTARAIASANIFMAGALLALCYLRSGSLALPVGVHLGWNWALETLGFPLGVERAADAIWTPVRVGGPAWLSGGVYGLEASAASLPVLTAAIVWLALRPPAVLQSRA